MTCVLHRLGRNFGLLESRRWQKAAGNCGLWWSRHARSVDYCKDPERANLDLALPSRESTGEVQRRVNFNLHTISQMQQQQQ